MTFQQSRGGVRGAVRARVRTRVRASVHAALLLGVVFAGSTVSAQSPGAARGVAALGRIEPLGGVIRVAAPSTPDAFSGAVITRLHVERGADVKAGQLLAELDTAPIAKARVAEAVAELETARRDAKAAVSVAEEACVLADVAARQSRRKTELLGRKLASAEETERAKGDAEAGAASCTARRMAARVAEARVAGAEAALTRRQAELARTEVRAPFDGRVLDVLARPGELVGLDGVVEFGRVHEMYAIAEVYETDVRYVRPGQKARVKGDALPREIAGTVTRVRPKVHKMDEIGTDPAARKDARIVEVEVRLDEPAAVANLTHMQVRVEIGR
jgi:HlyD family secretion protein